MIQTFLLECNLQLDQTDSYNSISISNLTKSTSQQIGIQRTFIMSFVNYNTYESPEK